MFEHVQNFRTDLLNLQAREEHCSNWSSLSLSLPKWPGMTKNDHPYKLEWSIRARSAVDGAQWDLGISSWTACYCLSKLLPCCTLFLSFLYHSSPCAVYYTSLPILVLLLHLTMFIAITLFNWGHIPGSGGTLNDTKCTLGDLLAPIIRPSFYARPKMQISLKDMHRNHDLGGEMNLDFKITKYGCPLFWYLVKSGRPL